MTLKTAQKALSATGSLVSPGSQPKVKTPLGTAPVIPVILFGLGAYLMWFGAHYWRDTAVIWPTVPIKSVLQGQGVPAATRPATETAVLTADISGATAPASSGGSTTVPDSSTSQIAADALQYQGHCYLYGGAPGTDGKGCWDCSSFVSWVLCHDLDIAISGYAGGAYDGSAHGPATTSYLFYGKPITRADVAAGDLVVYQTHMGIAISNTEMVAAQDPQLGTGTSNIDATTESLGETAFFRRVPGGK